MPPADSARHTFRFQTVNGTLPCLLDLDGPFLAEFAWPHYLQPIDRFVPQAMRDDFLPSISLPSLARAAEARTPGIPATLDYFSFLEARATNCR